MAETGKYLYCIIPCQEERTFDVVALGNNNGIVHTVYRKGIAAVISDSPVKQYESTRQNMMAHERVLEMVMKEFTLLPVRFGTVADSSSPVQDVQKLLLTRFGEFNQLLREMEGKVELGLKAFWRDEKAVFKEIIAENADIRRLRTALSGKSAEAIRLHGMRLGRVVKEALERKKNQQAARIMMPLRRIARHVRENDTLVDRMIVNAAFLVDKGQEQRFDQAVRQLDDELRNRIAFKYVGPAPPYNFVNIVVNWQDLR